jgi:alpha-methylacyl-CoA racemase
VGALERRFWRRFCRAIGRPDLDGLQYDQSPLARERVAAVMVERTREEWMELLAGHDVPVEPVLAPAAALEHPQLSHRGVVRRGSDGALRLAYPARFDGARPGRGERVPEPGEDTEQVLAEHQLPRDRRSGVRLRALGVGPRRSLRRWLAGWVARRQGL